MKDVGILLGEIKRLQFPLFKMATECFSEVLSSQEYVLMNLGQILEAQYPGFGFVSWGTHIEGLHEGRLSNCKWYDWSIVTPVG